MPMCFDAVKGVVLGNETMRILWVASGDSGDSAGASAFEMQSSCKAAVSHFMLAPTMLMILRAQFCCEAVTVAVEAHLLHVTMECSMTGKRASAGPRPHMPVHEYARTIPKQHRQSSGCYKQRPQPCKLLAVCATRRRDLLHTACFSLLSSLALQHINQSSALAGGVSVELTRAFNDAMNADSAEVWTNVAHPGVPNLSSADCSPSSADCSPNFSALIGMRCA